jgi:hypothetical protein
MRHPSTRSPSHADGSPTAHPSPLSHSVNAVPRTRVSPVGLYLTSFLALLSGGDPTTVPHWLPATLSTASVLALYAMAAEVLRSPWRGSRRCRRIRVNAQGVTPTDIPDLHSRQPDDSRPDIVIDDGVRPTEGFPQARTAVGVARQSSQPPLWDVNEINIHAEMVGP